MAYATAYYALLIRGRLRPDFSVLIHSGSGAVGLAAIQICLSRGCEVPFPHPLFPFCPYKTDTPNIFPHFCKTISNPDLRFKLGR